MKQRIYAILILLLPLNANAYSIGNHKVLTERAVQLINVCRSHGYLDTLDPASQLSVLLSYNIGQDIPFTRKQLLWHFPYDKNHPRKEEATTVLGNMRVVYTTFDRWTQYLSDQVSLTQRPAAVYPAMGALLHYVQDLASPAHAVPIFHPVQYFPPKPDGFDSWEDFESYSWLKDGEGKNYHQKITQEIKQVCHGIGEKGDVAQLLRHVSETTRQNITFGIQGTDADKLPDATSIWSKIWPLEPIEHDGFSRYGCDTDGDYGTKHLKCSHKAIERATYVAFASQQARLAVTSSAKLIVLLQKGLRFCNDPWCFAKDNVETWLPNKTILCALEKNVCGN